MQPTSGGRIGSGWGDPRGNSGIPKTQLPSRADYILLILADNIYQTTPVTSERSA